MSVDEWDQRMPCPDGACIGLIGSDGTCKVCGRVAPNWGDERKRGQVAADDDDDDEDDVDASESDDAYDEDDDDDDDDDGVDDDDDEEDDGDDEDDDEDDAEDDAVRTSADDSGLGAPPQKRGSDWSKRQLCSDGACIGVIGPDGKCTVCGSVP